MNSFLFFTCASKRVLETMLVYIFADQDNRQPFYFASHMRAIMAITDRLLFQALPYVYIYSDVRCNKENCLFILVIVVPSVFAQNILNLEMSVCNMFLFILFR